MNVISRFEGESLIVDNAITVTVLEIDGDEVLLQIDGAEGVQIECLEGLFAPARAD